MSENKTQLLTCPVCGQGGFYERGLKTHHCRAKPMVKGKRQRLTPAEIQRAIDAAKPSSTGPTWYPGERQGEAIREAKKRVYEAQTHGQDANFALLSLENCLHTIISTDDTPELQKLLERVQELHRRFNGMELGSFMIRVNNAMDEAYRRLP